MEIFKNSNSPWHYKILILVLILVSGFLVACNIMPNEVIVGNDSFIVYIKEDGLYFSSLNNGEETKIHEGKEFSYPVISKSGNYIAYINKDSLYIFDIKNKKYEKIADKMDSNYNSYDWIDDETIVYATKDPGFIIYNVLTKERKEHLDQCYYDNFKASNKNIIYGRKMRKWTTEEGDFVANDGIIEINLNEYDSKNKTFSTNIIIEGQKSTDETLGYNPIIWDITEDGKYIYIMEKSISASLSADGIGIGMYDVENKIHTKFENLTVLPYKDNLSINPKDSNLIGIIEGGNREMVLNKEVVLYDISSDKTYNTMYLMDNDLVAMTPSFTIDGDKLLYSATKGVDISKDFIDYNKAFKDWEVGPHHIYEYDLKNSQVKKVTEGDYFDFMPISISKDEILFSRYKGNGHFSLIKLVNGKENIIADNIIFDYHNEGRACGFYGHIGTEKAMDIYLNEKDGDFENKAENQYTNNIKKVEVIFNEDNPHFNGVKPISITDKKMINDIMNMLKDSKPIQNDEKMGKMSGMSYKDNKLIITGVDNEKTEIKYTFDTLYNIGFIEIDGEKLEPKYDFFRYMFDLIEYGEYDTDIDKEVAQLFKKYNWTIDYKVSTIKEKLPSNLKHIAGEYPIKLYWAYNNELSKSIGLDFSNYLGNTVEAEIYRLREPLPEYMKPRLNARGIVIKKDGKIIGAYIDAGRHESFACSLDRKNLKEIINKDWDEWIQDYIDYNDKLEKELAKLSPEEIIKTYFKALDSHDVKIAKACLSRTQLNVGMDLSANMSNRELYNKKAYDYIDSIKSVKLLKIEKIDEKNSNTDVLKYRVSADYKYKKVITHEDGVLPFIVVMRKESEKSGWKIEDIGF